MCAGKVVFANHADAMRVEKRHSTDDRKARHAYHCTACKKWHLGTRPGKVAKVKRVRLEELRGEDE